jgi:hypothetical protein
MDNCASVCTDTGEPNPYKLICQKIGSPDEMMRLAEMATRAFLSTYAKGTH